MTTLRTAAQQALEALGSSLYPQPRQMAAIAALRAALAEPVQEPVATMTVREDMGADFKFIRPHALQPGQKFYLYTAPPQRKPLTEEEIYAAIKGVDSLKAVEVARAVERAHGITGEQT